MTEVRFPQIKICGITRKQEIDWLLALPVDYIGMVLFFPKSKRNLTVEQAVSLVQYVKGQNLSRSPRLVAVMVSPDAEQIRQVVQIGFDCIQIHGRIKPDIVKEIKIPLIRAYNMKEERETFCELAGLREKDVVVEGCLFDAPQPGSGQSFDWSMLPARREGRAEKIFLAGGLCAQTVSEAIRQVDPDVVDVSSAVEAVTQDGSFQGKDREKIIEFVDAVKKSGKK